MSNRIGAIISSILICLPVLLSGQAESVPSVYYAKKGTYSDKIKENSGTNEISSVTLNEVIKRALKNSPQLQSKKKEIEAAEALKKQAGLIPNPEFELEAENFLGSGPFNGFNGLEVSGSFSQEIMLAGRLSKQTAIANATSNIAAQEYEIARMDLITSVREKYYEIVGLQQEIKKTSELKTLAEEFVSNLSTWVDLGKISPVEVSRALLTVNELELSVNRLKGDLKSAKRSLSLLTGKEDFVINSVPEDNSTVKRLPKIEELKSVISETPEVVLSKKREIQKNREIDLQKALAVPNLKVGAGMKYVKETGDNAFLISAGIPLPIFDRNQGNIEAALAELGSVESTTKSITLELLSKLDELYSTAQTEINTLNMLQSSLLPQARKALEIIKDGNKNGRFTILDVLDSQRTLFELESEYLKTNTELKIVLARLERITGKSLSSIDKGE